MNTNIKKFSIKKAFWLGFGFDKLMIGGTFLPSNIHITMPYGYKTNYIDFHLTKNIKNGGQIHASLIKIHRDDFIPILVILGKRFLNYLLGSLKEVSISWLIENNFVFIPFPQANSKQYDKVASKLFKPLAPIVHQKGKEKYIDIDNEETKNLLESFFFMQPDNYSYKWIINNARHPSLIRRYKKCYGMVISKSNSFGFLRLPLYNYKYKNFIISPDLLLKDVKEIFKLLVGDKMFAQVKEKYSESYNQLSKAVDKSDLTSKPMTLKPKLK